MPKSFERQFVVSPAGEAEEVKDETKNEAVGLNNKKVLGMAKNRKFIVNEQGEAIIEGDNKERPADKRKDGSVEEFVK